ncbi:MAG: isoleucine--tRNA ligase [Corynebacterium sp.]|nr:isoleucine--tRNA ligase [Corynebacterium sp.]
MSDNAQAGQVGSVYPKVDMTGGSSRFPAMEEIVQEYWKEDSTFNASLKKTKECPEYIFYDGPPFANGLPHYGHLLTGYVKDIVPRYRTMAGNFVPRVFGWDCHGLPAELEAEKQLGITDKGQIEDMGLEKFNEYCAQSVLRYANEWENYVTRQARWVDFDNGYKTMDQNFMESVMWAFKTLYDKGLIYQGFRVLPYSWAEHTPLSNQETRLDDSYKMRQDPTLTVTFPVVKPSHPELAGAAFLAWTTTPWTLPSNLALAVHPEVDYAVVKLADGSKYVLADSLRAAYAKELGDDHEVIAKLKGTDLAGSTYEPIFGFFPDEENAYQVLLADYVTTEDGTGVVHQAPAFGEDDMATCQKNGIGLVIPVDDDGKFTSQVPPYQGQLVFDANKDIIKDLKEAGRVVRHQTIEHSYPHSWRSGEPLIYKAMPAWFVKVTEFRDRMVELNHNEIEWMPAHIRDGQFGKWLEGARDWNISRSRYWGSPIPVWMSDDENYPRVDVYGSLDELERDFGVRPQSLHRPHIDELTRPNPDDPTGKSMMRRVPEVLDCWFESGSMPFAQKHYPFENKEWFETHSPADFIVEYSGQTRGWFYVMHVLSTALFDRPAYKKVVAHGIVLGNDGLKMSKSKGNYPDVNEVFERDGSDAMRWFLMSSPILRGGNLIVTEQGIRDGVRQAILPVWNAYTFLQLYASSEANFDTSSTNVLDRYILAKTHDLVRDINEALANTDIATATEHVRLFADALTNWYVRRSRDRFWAGDDQHPEAFNTLYTVLHTVARVIAPLLPHIAEVIFRGLTGERSVHLADFPRAEDFPADDNLVAAMDTTRAVSSAASSVRKANKLRNRLPLPKLTIAVEDSQQLADFTDIIRDEVNVKDVELTDDVDSVGTFEVVCNAKVAGPRLGKDVQRAIKNLKAGNYTRQGDDVIVDGDLVLSPAEYTERLQAADPKSTARIGGLDGLVVLDTTVTEELEAEGWAADVIRGLQDARKASGLEVSDRISVTLAVPADREQWAQRHAEHIAAEVLATEFVITTDNNLEGAHDIVKSVTATVTKN